MTICIINSYDTKWASFVQVLFTAAKLVGIIIIIIGGFVRLGQGKHFCLSFLCRRLRPMDVNEKFHFFYLVVTGRY